MSLNLYRRIPLWQNAMDEMMRDMQRFDHFAPYWNDNRHIMGVGSTSQEVVDDDTKFAVSVDVSHFKPEELKVNLDGKVLSIEGKQEVKENNGYMLRSFTRKWTLPDSANLAEVRSSLSPDGHLSIEAPKTGQTSSARAIPIVPGPKKEAITK